MAIGSPPAKITRETDGVGNAEGPALIPIGEAQAQVRAVVEELEDVTHRPTAHHDEDLAGNPISRRVCSG